MLVPFPSLTDRAGQRYVLENVPWRTYQTLLIDLGEHGVRLTFDRGRLEFMAPSFNRERCGRRFDRFVMTLADEMDIPVQGGGSTTFRKEELERGLEPDQCYYVANVALIRGKAEIDLDGDPPPDLAIEVDITSSSLDRMSIYAALGVPEVWRFDGRVLRIYLLGEDREYRESSRSVSFPFLPVPEIVPPLQRTEDMDETAMTRACRAWIREKMSAGWSSQINGN
jgi:Uma2 family endonuclease